MMRWLFTNDERARRHEVIGRSSETTIHRITAVTMCDQAIGAADRLRSENDTENPNMQTVDSLGFLRRFLIAARSAGWSHQKSAMLHHRFRRGFTSAP
jgi:hypothetical protein